MARRGKHQRPRRLSASDLAALGRCEQQAMFRHHNRVERVDPVLAAARRRGDFEHARRNRSVTAKRSRRGPCFIASAVYGGNAWQTETLRAWRDRSLLRNQMGRAFVHVYYRLSPPVANALARRPWAVRLVRVLLDRLVQHVARRIA